MNVFPRMDGRGDARAGQRAAVTALLARVSRLVIGADDPKTGACGLLRNVVDDPRLNHRIDVRRGVLEAPCSEILKQFFQKLRQQES